jgi:hypothetical protein
MFLSGQESHPLPEKCWTCRKVLKIGPIFVRSTLLTGGVFIHGRTKKLTERMRLNPNCAGQHELFRRGPRFQTSITIANYLLARLTELGVRQMFGVPGDFNLWFLEQTINSSDITFIGCCNELNASYAADGCARLTNISALVTSYGVGELASLAGVAGAYAERVAIVCIIAASHPLQRLPTMLDH